MPERYREVQKPERKWPHCFQVHSGFSGHTSERFSGPERSVTTIFKLILESYKDLWERDKVAFILNVSSIIISAVAIIISILK